MAKTYSPLRYPGGKNQLSKFVGALIEEKKMKKSTYVEPFCGGAAVALSLLINNKVKKIVINDYDKSIYSFWYSVVYFTDEICEMIEKIDITMNEWNKQKEIQKNKNNEDILTLGFSTLFLNRTNRSGIIKAGVIGGKAQNGNYKLDCRFNKKDIINKIRKIASYRNRIEIYNLDTEELIDEVIGNLEHKSFIFFDPPYYNKGASLYTNFYKHDDHVSLSNKIKNIKYHSWILTYDNTNEIKDLYKSFRKEIYKLNYSLQKKQKGEEVIFYSKTLSKMIKDGKQSIYNYCSE
ncbi:MAG: DNA adenine methylase [Clostridium sp.]